MVLGQGQSDDLHHGYQTKEVTMSNYRSSSQCCLINMFGITKIGTLVATRDLIIIIDIQDHVKVNFA